MLVAFDFDGTLSDDEMVLLLGEQAGAGREIARITREAMNGSLGYAESLRERVGFLAGLPEDAVQKAYAKIRLRQGASVLLGELMGYDVTTAIITGGFEDGVRCALENASVSVDSIVANRLVRENGQLTGTVTGPLIDGTKDHALNDLADSIQLDLTDTIAIGDGANDVPMLDAAGYAIGYQPKPLVQSHCDLIVESMPALQSELKRILTQTP